jgi:hypothetical protein
MKRALEWKLNEPKRYVFEQISIMYTKIVRFGQFSPTIYEIINNLVKLTDTYNFEYLMLIHSN